MAMLLQRVRKDTEQFDSSRMLFISGQVVKGNLKRKRAQTPADIMNRISTRREISQLEKTAATKVSK